MTITLPNIWKYGKGTVRLALISDVQSGTFRQNVADLIAGWNVDAIITSGDNSEGGKFTDFNATYQPWLSRGDVFTVLGNHDYETLTGTFDYGSGYLANFPAVANSYYYQLDLGPITFFMLNSYPSSIPDPPTIGAAQEQWFQRSVAASQAYWKVANFHHPPYTSYTAYGNHTWMQWNFPVDIVTSGHVHLYERLLINGVHYIVNISAGKSLRPPGTLLPQSQFRYWAEYGAMLWEVSPTKLVAQLRNLENAVVDQLTLTK